MTDTFYRCCQMIDRIQKNFDTLSAQVSAEELSDFIKILREAESRMTALKDGFNRGARVTSDDYAQVDIALLSAFSSSDAVRVALASTYGTLDVLYVERPTRVDPLMVLRRRGEQEPYSDKPLDKLKDVRALVEKFAVEGGLLC